MITQPVTTVSLQIYHHSTPCGLLSYLYAQFFQISIKDDLFFISGQKVLLNYVLQFPGG